MVTRQVEWQKHRLLGKSDSNNRLLTFAETLGIRNTNLVTIRPDQIREHLVMVYFLECDSKKGVELAAELQSVYGLELRKGVDRRGKEYYWRVNHSARNKSTDGDDESDYDDDVYPTRGDYTCIDGEWIHNDAWQHD